MINRAEVSGGFWFWIYSTLCEPGDWVYIDMCGSGTEVCMALLAQCNVVGCDIRQSQVSGWREGEGGREGEREGGWAKRVGKDGE